MAGYIGKVQIAELGLSGDPVLIGSTLYGICRSPVGTAAKTVVGGENGDDNSGKFINNNYDNLIQGTTIHVKFINGNSAASNVTLQVGTTNQAKPVDGRFVCDAGTIISFTYDENEHWVVNDNIDTNTEYVFAGNTPYNASTNKALAESSVSAAAHRGIITDIANNSSSENLPTTAAVVSYVQSMTGGLAGLSGAMHFRGIVTDSTVTITDGGTELPKIEGYDLENGVPKPNFTPEAGDVILFHQQEYVWSSIAWELLGDESSYALKSVTDYITEVGVFTANTLPTLTVTDTSVSQVSVTNGSAASLTTNDVTIPKVNSTTSASVIQGVLTITLGQIDSTPITVKEVNVFTANTPTAVTATPVTVGSASGWNAGSQASLTTNNTVVVVPVAPNSP